MRSDKNRNLRLQRARHEDGRLGVSFPFMLLGGHFWRPAKPDCGVSRAQLLLGRGGFGRVDGDEESKLGDA